MKALVVFESMYGDNQRVAEAIGEGLSPGYTVEIVEVGSAPKALPVDLDLLVVGGPNHMTSMTRGGSRADAAKRAEKAVISSGIGLREWFEELQAESAGPAAAWDTRLGKPRFLRIFDRASRAIEKRLKQRGFRLVAKAEHFYVVDAEGPLVEGEVERAKAWGKQLAIRIGTGSAATS